MSFVLCVKLRFRLYGLLGGASTVFVHCDGEYSSEYWAHTEQSA